MAIKVILIYMYLLFYLQLVRAGDYELCSSAGQKSTGIAEFEYQQGGTEGATAVQTWFRNEIEELLSEVGV